MSLGWVSEVPVDKHPPFAIALNEDADERVRSPYVPLAIDRKVECSHPSHCERVRVLEPVNCAYLVRPQSWQVGDVGLLVRFGPIGAEILEVGSQEAAKIGCVLGLNIFQEPFDLRPGKRVVLRRSRPRIPRVTTGAEAGCNYDNCNGYK